MNLETAPALQNALQTAPVDPLGDGRVTVYAHQQVDRIKSQIPDFGTLYNSTLTEAGFGQQEKDAIDRYLAFTAFTIANFNPSPLTLDQKERVEAKAGFTLFQHLAKPDIQTEQVAFERTRQTLYSATPDLQAFLASPPDQSAPTKHERGDCDLQNEQLLRTKITELVDATTGSPLNMRGVRAIYNQVVAYAAEIGYKNPRIFDLSLGDLNLTVPMEDGFQDVPEALGVSGEKQQRIRQRAIEYEELMKRAGTNPYGYDSRAVGWMALRDRFGEYLHHFGLNGYIRGGTDYLKGGNEIDGSYVAYGGSDGMERAYLIARQTIRDEIKDQDYVPTATFFTPSFMMMEQVAKNCGINTKQFVTNPQDHFLPTDTQLKEFLEKNTDVDMVVLTPINNPGSHIAEADRVRTLMNVLKEYEEQGRKITLINDLAYLGTGNEQANKELGAELNTFTRRIDVLPLTKIGGETGLRCCVGMTPDQDLARHIEPVTKTKVLAMAYAMQTRALAKLDYVSIPDMHRLMELYQYRQNQLTEILKLRSDLFDVSGITVGGDEDESMGGSALGNSALYLWVPLKDGVDPRDILKFGLFGTPPDAFYFPKTESVPRYIRFALGVVPMTDEIISQMRSALTT